MRGAFAVTIGGEGFSLPVDFATLERLEAHTGLDPGAVLRGEQALSLVKMCKALSLGTGGKLSAERIRQAEKIVDIQKAVLGWFSAIVLAFGPDDDGRTPGPKD